MQLRNALLLTLCTLLALPLWAQESVPEVARQMLEEADRHRESGRDQQAIGRYREVLSLAPSLLDAYVGLGAIYHRAKDYEEASAVFGSGLERFPDDPTLLFNAAATEMRLGNLERALDYSDRCVAVNNDDTAVHSLRGTILRRLGRLDDALESLERVAKIDSKSARAQYNLGNVYHQLGRKDDALAAYREAIDNDRSFQPAHYNLGAVLFELEQFEEALAAYELALAPIEEDFAKGREVSPAHARAYLNLGAIFLGRQSWDRALDAYEKAVRLDPTQAAAHYNVGYIQYELGKAAAAYAAYQKAVELDSELPLSYLHMGLIDFRSGRMEEAVYWLDNGLPRLQGSQRSTAVLTLAQAQQALGDGERAEASYRVVLREDPGNVTALVNLGRLLRVRGSLDEARSLLEHASDSVLDSSGVAIELAALARASGDLPRERAMYEDVLRRDGDRVGMWPVRLNLAGVLIRTGAHDQALAQLDLLAQQSKAIGSSDPDVVYQIRTIRALLNARRGEIDEARAALAAVAEERPDFFYAVNGLAAVVAISGDKEEASRHWAGLVARTSGTPLDALVRANLGQTLWLSGQSDEARVYLLEAAERFPSSSLIRVALGEIALAQSDFPGARRELNAAVETCGNPEGAAPPGSALVELNLGGATELVCERAQRGLGIALVASVGTRTIASMGESARALDEALQYPLDDSLRAQALFMRGTLFLQQRQDVRARTYLARAIAGALPESLVAAAHNNLGVALYRSGATVEAVDHFRRARANQRVASATLNLAIASHDDKQPEQALSLYEAYVAEGGARSDDAQRWAEAIRRIYR